MQVDKVIRRLGAAPIIGRLIAGLASVVGGGIVVTILTGCIGLIIILLGLYLYQFEQCIFDPWTYEPCTQSILGPHFDHAKLCAAYGHPADFILNFWNAEAIIMSRFNDAMDEAAGTGFAMGLDLYWLRDNWSTFNGVFYDYRNHEAVVDLDQFQDFLDALDALPGNPCPTDQPPPWVPNFDPLQDVFVDLQCAMTNDLIPDINLAALTSDPLIWDDVYGSVIDEYKDCMMRLAFRCDAP
jgi:hypothetical protein